MNAKHTPGPWRVRPNGVIVGGPEIQYVNGSAQQQIAMVTSPRDAEAPEEEQRANALIMGASLDMLSALRALLFTADDSPAYDAAIAQARAAIAKATGAA